MKKCLIIARSLLYKYFIVTYALPTFFVQNVTFQAIISTDGIRTYATFLYQDKMMTWRPVYDVPKDIPNYPALSGIFVKGPRPVVQVHSSSGVWAEVGNAGNNQTVYRLNEVPAHVFATVSFVEYLRT